MYDVLFKPFNFSNIIFNSAIITIITTTTATISGWQILRKEKKNFN